MTIITSGWLTAIARAAAEQDDWPLIGRPTRDDAKPVDRTRVPAVSIPTTEGETTAK
jgi:hypothetical protein